MLKATLELIYINKMEKDLFFNVADIVKRAKRVLNFKIDADLAAYLGVVRVSSHLVTRLRKNQHWSKHYRYSRLSTVRNRINFTMLFFFHSFKICICLLYLSKHP